MGPAGEPGPTGPGLHLRGCVSAVVFGVLLLWTSQAAAADLAPEAVVAWARHAAAAETRLEQGWEPDRPVGRVHAPVGESIAVSGGTIHVWRGSVLVHDMQVDRLVGMLTHPGTPPPQEDVRESRVLGRSGETLRVYLKLVRHAIVTVTYDTEHEVVFRRHSATAATSRSTATRISEVGGRDRGFLWRLNSYWRYVQAGDDVFVDVESLSLSRTVPALVRPVAAPLISRVGRESMTRTLEALKAYAEKSGAGCSGKRCAMQGAE